MSITSSTAEQFERTVSDFIHCRIDEREALPRLLSLHHSFGLEDWIIQALKPDGEWGLQRISYIESGQ